MSNSYWSDGMEPGGDYSGSKRLYDKWVGKNTTKTMFFVSEKPVAVWQHRVHINGRWKYVTCLKKDKKDSADACPWCKSGSKVQRRGIFVVFDPTTYTKLNKETAQEETKVSGVGLFNQSRTVTTSLVAALDKAKEKFKGRFDGAVDICSTTVKNKDGKDMSEYNFETATVTDVEGNIKLRIKSDVERKMVEDALADYVEGYEAWKEEIGRDDLSIAFYAALKSVEPYDFEYANNLMGGGGKGREAKEEVNLDEGDTEW